MLVIRARETQLLRREEGSRVPDVRLLPIINRRLLPHPLHPLLLWLGVIMKVMAIVVVLMGVMILIVVLLLRLQLLLWRMLLTLILV